MATVTVAHQIDGAASGDPITRAADVFGVALRKRSVKVLFPTGRPGIVKDHRRALAAG
jgi:hypothetical protein